MENERIELTAEELKTMSIKSLAALVQVNWRKVYFGAVPYLQAMRTMYSIDDYGADSGKSIVRYFLANAQTWRGPVAKLVKAELKRRAGVK